MKYEIVDIKKIKLGQKILELLTNLVVENLIQLNQNTLIAAYLRGDTGNTEAGPSC